ASTFTIPRLPTASATLSPARTESVTAARAWRTAACTSGSVGPAKRCLTRTIRGKRGARGIPASLIGPPPHGECNAEPAGAPLPVRDRDGHPRRSERARGGPSFPPGAGRLAVSCLGRPTALAPARGVLPLHEVRSCRGGRARGLAAALAGREHRAESAPPPDRLRRPDPAPQLLRARAAQGGRHRGPGAGPRAGTRALHRLQRRRR